MELHPWLNQSKDFVSLAKKVNSEIITKHCFLHREVLVGKTLDPHLKQMLKKVIKMINYIKARPLKSGLFAKVCKEMEASYENLLLHTGIVTSIPSSEGRNVSFL